MPVVKPTKSQQVKHKHIKTKHKTEELDAPLYQIYLFFKNTLHVSDGLSVHHQELKTVHKATGICRTDTAVCLLATRRQYLYDKCLLLYVQS